DPAPDRDVHLPPTNLSHQIRPRGLRASRLVARRYVVTRLGWLGCGPGPVAAAYEAIGPTGFGLSRTLNAAGIRWEGVVPSKLQRPSGDRVKTDAKDAVLGRGGLAPTTRLPDREDHARAVGAGRLVLVPGHARGIAHRPASWPQAAAAARGALR